MPAVNITDLNNAKLDVDHIDDVANSAELTATNRHEVVKETVAGALYKIGGINNRGAWAALTAYAQKDIVLTGGTWYICVVAHTSSALFATDSASKWRVYQGVTSGDLAAATGSALVGYQRTATNAAVLTLLAKLDECAFSVNDFIGTDLDDKLVNALAALTTAAYPTSGAPLVIPPGNYTINTAIAIPAKSVTIIGYGAKITSSASVAFDLGQDSYITNISAGYYKIHIEGLHIVPAAGGTGIRNKGIRTLTLQNVSSEGGATALDSEGAFAMSWARGCRFRTASSHLVRLRQRNNLFAFYQTAFLAASGRGLLIDTTSFGASPNAENKGIKLFGCDFEGNAGALNIEGNVGNTILDGCWWEGNTTYNIRLDNTVGTYNKFGVSIRNCQITGAGVDVLIGTDTGGTLIEGVTIEDNEFVDSDLVVIGGGKVSKLSEGGNRYSSTSTKTIPAAGLTSLSGSRAMRYESSPTEPFGYAATGVQGDVRYGDGKVWLKDSGGWLLVQANRVVDFSNTMSTLATGATPSVARLGKVRTNNSGATTVASLTGGFVTQEVCIIGLDGGNTTIAHGTNIRLAGGANFTLGDHDTITLICLDGTKWVEKGRSNNT